MGEIIIRSFKNEENNSVEINNYLYFNRPEDLKKVAVL